MSEIAEAPKPRLGSLEERIAQRREALERVRTEKFEVPGYEGIFMVELRMVGGKRQLAIVNKHERIRDEYRRLLSSAVDLVLAATVDFYVLDAEGNPERADGATWLKLAQAADKTLPDSTTADVAILRLLGEQGVTDLAADWRMWMRNRGAKVEAELGDFS